MSAKVAVVIPIYKEELNDLEKISLAQVRKVLKNYPLIFVAPEGKNFPYLQPGDMLVQFHPQYFQSVETYSRLLLSPMFYEPFLVFDYILLYQLDAFVFYDALEDFCRLDYDYIGAAWPYHVWQGLKFEKMPRVGNGGFSLRKVKACHKILTECADAPGWNWIFQNFIEDAFFAICGVTEGTNFKVAPIDIANAFSMEWYPERCVKRLGYTLPFGCHNWHRFSADFYVEIFAQLGYDLRPFRAQMGDKIYEEQILINLTRVAMDRLIREVQRGKFILPYLPTNRFASVRVIRSPAALKILARLLMEENSIADKIFIYDEKDFRDLVYDIKREDLPHLTIVSDYDRSLTESIEQQGLIYGRHFISFQEEYLKVQRKIFHNLGK